MKKILVSAIEPSANFYLKEILKLNNGDLKLFGIFDESIAKPNFSSNLFNVMGIFSIIPKIFLAKKILKELVILAENVDKIFLIDAPSFNLRLAKLLKKKYANLEIIYFILPKVWAWKEKRKELVNKLIDVQISIFPFEKDYFPNSFYFGNPLLNSIKYFRDEVVKNSQIAFLPGSRKNEIKNLMPIFREIAKKLDNKKLILVVPPHLKDLSIYGDISNFEIIRETETALKNSEFAFICSGTATLESAVIGTPFVLVYKTNPIEFFIGKSLIKLKFVGLANIIFEKLNFQDELPFHKELLQNFSADDLINEFKNSNSEEFLKKSKRLRKILAGNTYQEIIERLKK